MSPLWSWFNSLAKRHQHFVRFALVGLSGLLVNLLFVALGLWLFRDFHGEGQENAASALGIGMSIVSNFFLNEHWTWGDRQKGQTKKAYLARFGGFVVTALLGALVQYGVAYSMRHAWSLSIYFAQIVGILIATVFNFTINNYLIFKDKK